MKNKLRVIQPVLFIIFSISLLGCKSEKTTKTNVSSIAWHKGTMEQALSLAKEKKTPLFVYWGAKWCPPCNVIKSTIFVKDEFINATKKYISVYLDGDSESAQIWGEKLKALGYPTLMILDPQGQEVVRLSNEMKYNELAESLNSIYENLKPIDQLIASINQQKPGEVSLDMWKLVAGYSWTQAKKIENGLDWAKVYYELYKKIPEKYEIEKKQLFLNSVLARLEKQKKLEKEKVETQVFSAEEKSNTIKQLEVFLADEKISKEHMKFFSYYGENILQGFFDVKESSTKTARASFVKLYKNSMGKVRSAQKKGTYERLITFYPMLGFQDLDKEEFTLSEDEKNKLKEEVLEGFNRAKTKEEKVFITSTGTYLLQEAGFVELAKKELLKDIKTSKTPYYSMAGLARMAKKAGNKVEALKWYEQAYQAAQGPSTRLQWGSGYILSLIELTPEKKQEVASKLSSFFDENLHESGSFVGRNRYRLKRISKKLKEWVSLKDNASTKKQLQEMQKKWLGTCSKKSTTKTEYYEKSCSEFFKTLI